MKRLISLCFVMVIGCVSTPAPQNSAYLSVQTINGNIDISTDGNGWHKLQKSAKVPAGATLRTDSNSFGTFDLQPEGGTLTLHPGSILEVQRLGRATPNNDVIAVLNLRAGRITGDTMKAPGRTKIVVNSPNGMHEIR